MLELALVPSGFGQMRRSRYVLTDGRAGASEVKLLEKGVGRA